LSSWATKNLLCFLVLYSLSCKGSSDTLHLVEGEDAEDGRAVGKSLLQVELDQGCPGEARNSHSVLRSRLSSRKRVSGCPALCATTTAGSCPNLCATTTADSRRNQLLTVKIINRATSLV
jgi:hypothetical protein